MGKRKYPEKTSAREKKWNNIFNALVELTQTLQNDREILAARVQHLEEVNYKTKMEHKVDSLKAILILGLKERESIVYKNRYENAEYDLVDFRDWCDHLVRSTNDISGKGESSRNKALQDEVRQLKTEIGNYKLEKNAEISALLSEKNFVWNQYKQMESSFTEQLRKKCEEVENANEKVQMLVSRSDEMFMTNEQLQANIAKMESESIQKNEEILELRKEIDILKSRSGSASTSLRPCRQEPASSSRRDKNSGTTSRKIVKVKKEPNQSQTTRKGNSSSKRKAIDVIVIPDTPKLFSSSFKVPKLKNSSSSK